MNNTLLKMEIPEALSVTELEQGRDEKERFRVTGKDSANWCLRKIRALKSEMDENIKMAREEIERIQEWLEQVNTPLENSVKHFEALLEEYHIQVISEDPDRKTIKLPHGTLKLRARQPEYKRDEKTLLSFLKDNGLNEFIKVIEKPEWGVLKKNVELAGDKVVHRDTGLIVEGVTVEKRPPGFTVEVI